MTLSDWDNTPWAGEALTNVVELQPSASSVKADAAAEAFLIATKGDAWVNAVKASYGDGWLAAYQQGGINLSSLTATEPQEKARRLLQAYKVGWFNKAERKISTDFAGLAVSIAPEDNEGDNQAEVVEPDLMAPWATLDPIGQFLRLMEKPNPYQTGRQLRQKTMIRLDMAGWAFWYTELGSDGLVTEDGLYGISPARLWPSYDKQGTLIGYVLDKNREGGGVPFEVNEIVPFSYNSADDDLVYGVGVVEAIWAQIPLTELMARHVGDILTTGGRLAGAMWPKNRALDEAEFEDAKRAWRSVASDPNAARRLLIFPEPMEWSQGGSTPAEIGIPELATLNRDDILTSFPMSPYQLGVPMPGGLNSAATREEDRRDYWEGTIHPRVELFEEVIQTYLVPRYENVVGYTLDFEIAEPNLDDGGRIIEKVGALDALVAAGFDEKEAVAAVGLEHIKFIGKPEPPPPPTTVTVSQTPKRGVNDLTNQPVVTAPTGGTAPTKAVRRERDDVLDPATTRAIDRLNRFFTDQRNRVIQSWRSLPSTKAGRKDAIKSDPDWWDADAEDELLTDTMRGIYLEVGTGGLQAVSDTLGRAIMKGFVRNVLADLLEYGGQRIKDINERTLQALTLQLAEGTRRGYSINQLIDGVPDEGYTGIAGVTLDNGTPAFDEYRSEMIARTETMLSYNRATVTGYGEFGVTTLLAYDGDQDEMCAQRNGREFSIEEALTEEDHPNGTLVWSPVVDKSWNEDREDRLYELAAKAIDRQPTEIHVHNAAPDVHVTPPDVHVSAPVTIEPQAISVDVPPTVVNVNVPEQPAPEFHMDAPVFEVHVPEQEPPTITVNVPEQPAPIVNVKAQPVVVNTPAEMRITGMPDRLTQRSVKRNDKGAIIETTDVETDA